LVEGAGQFADAVGPLHHGQPGAERRQLTGPDTAVRVDDDDVTVREWTEGLEGTRNLAVGIERTEQPVGQTLIKVDREVRHKTGSIEKVAFEVAQASRDGNGPRTDRHAGQRTPDGTNGRRAPRL